MMGKVNFKLRGEIFLYKIETIEIWLGYKKFWGLESTYEDLKHPSTRNWRILLLFREYL